MIVSVPCSAAAAPPEMPASTNSTPRSARAAWIFTVELGAAVLRSIDDLALARALSSSPPSPNTTASTASESGSERNTTSTSAASSAIDAGRLRCRTPRSARRCGRSPARAARHRRMRRAIRPPMLPRPIIPLAVRRRLGHLQSDHPMWTAEPAPAAATWLEAPRDVRVVTRDDDARPRARSA